MTTRRRLLLVFFGSAVLPIALAAVAFSWGALRVAERRERASTSASLDALGRAIDAELDAERRYLGRILAELAEVADPLVDVTARLAVHRDVGARFAREPYLTSRFLVLGEGFAPADEIRGRATELEVVARAASVPASELPAVYRDVVRSGAVAPPPLTLFRPTGPILAVSVPMPAERPEGGLVLVEEISVILLLEHLLEGPAGADLSAALAAAGSGDAWSILYDTDLVRIGLPLPPDDWRREAASGAGPVFRRAGDLLHAAAIHATTGWLVGATRSMSASLAPIRANLRVTLFAIACMVLVTMSGIFLVTRGIGRSVEEIARGAEAIAGGDLSRTIRVPRRDEFGTIADHINELTRELVLTAESRSIARISSRIVHDLKGVASQMNLLAHNLRANPGDPEFRAELPELVRGLAGQVETLALRLRRRDEEREPNWEPVQLNEAVAETLDRRVGPVRPGIAVRRELAADAVPRADRELVLEVVTGLVTNALEAMGERGALVVRTGRASPRGGAPTHFLEVEDSGAGMSPEFVREHLFRPFVTTKPNGLGLGMYHVRQAITKMKGRIEVTSEEGVGTRVRVELGRGERSG